VTTNDQIRGYRQTYFQRKKKYGEKLFPSLSSLNAAHDTRDGVSQRISDTLPAVTHYLLGLS